MRQRAHLFLITFLIISTGLTASVPAQEETAGDYFYGISTKFGRGLWNVISSPAEIPCTTKVEMDNKGGAGFLPGVGKGTLFMLRRILVGVTEVGTFVIPMERTIPEVCREEI